jgi:hypothetical protein
MSELPNVERMTEPELIELYRAYRFSNRKPILVTNYTIGKNLLDITGFDSRQKFDDFLKFSHHEDVEPYRSIADIEGTVYPQPTRLVFRSIPKIVEVSL